MDRSGQKSRLGIFLTLALLVHAAILIIPHTARTVSLPGENLTVRLVMPPPVVVPEEVFIPEPTVPQAESETPLEPEPPVETRTIPVLPPEPAIAADQPPVEQEPQTSSEVVTRQIISSQYDFDAIRRQSVFGPPAEKEEPANLTEPLGVSLEAVLNEPSLQLPFEDKRIYLVDAYDNGVMGGMQRFWDAATVEFGFKTKGNTEIRCAWVLVVAACGWDHASRFYRPAKKRKTDES